MIVAGFRSGASPGTIAGGLAAVGLILQPLRDLGSVWNLRAAYTAARTKAEAALARRARGRPATRKSLQKGSLSLSLEQVLLPSGDKHSLTIEAGGTRQIELQDTDAASLFDMIQKLDSAPEGCIRIGDRDAFEISPRSLRRRVVRVGGPVVILQGTVRRALTLGVDDRPDDATLRACADEAGLGPMLTRLGGLKGRVHEGGRTLSPRERSLIGLVRARARKPGLILLDTTAGQLHDADLERIEVVRHAVPGKRIARNAEGDPGAIHERSSAFAATRRSRLTSTTTRAGLAIGRSGSIMAPPS